MGGLAEGMSVIMSRSQRVLIVEDEYFLASDLRDALEREGMIVVGPVATEAKALALLTEGGIDCAILDINLNGQASYAVAVALRARGIPFLFVTGYDSVAEDTAFGDVELILKPWTADAIIAGIARMTATPHRS